jgi:hypothetical protein
MNRFKINGVILMFMFLPCVSSAGVYKCPGEDGKIVFTDIPCKKEHVEQNNLEYVNKKRESHGMGKISSKDQRLIIKNYEMAKKDYNSYLKYVKAECGDEPALGHQNSEERLSWDKWYRCDRKTQQLLKTKRQILEAAEKMYRNAVH